MSLNRFNCPNLTATVKKFREEKVSSGQRLARNNSGDMIYYFTSSCALLVEYCVKQDADGRNYVNWARLTGPEEERESFLQEAGFYGVNSEEPEL